MNKNKKNKKREIINKLVSKINGLILLNSKALSETTVSDYAFLGGTLENFKILHKMINN